MQSVVLLELSLGELLRTPSTRSSHPGYAFVNSKNFVLPSVNRALNAESAEYLRLCIDASEKTTVVLLH